MNKLIHSNEPVIMGIVNVTPDSFSGDGFGANIDAAIEHGLRLHREGAAILDIGGESTNPQSTPIEPEEEIRRVIPVIEGLKDCGAVLSIDTRHTKTMEASLAAGATFINDVNALQDGGALSVAASSGAGVCLMHMQGTPQTMQMNPHYDDVVAEVFEFLENRIEACVNAGVDNELIAVDPGIGFGKTLDHNVILMKNIDKFLALGVPVLLGASRKRFIEAIVPATPVDKRLPGSVAAVLAAYQKDVRLFRVHDVAETVQALEVFKRIA